MKNNLLYSPLILFLFACESETAANNISNSEETEIARDSLLDSRKPFSTYKSNSESFQPNFFLKLNEQNAILYGWEEIADNDTIYYKSICKIEENTPKTVRLRLDEYELSKIRTNQDNLDQFEADTSILLPYFGIFHCSFFGDYHSENSIQLQAVKHIYMSRADLFTFERLK